MKQHNLWKVYNDQTKTMKLPSIFWKIGITTNNLFLPVSYEQFIKGMLQPIFCTNTNTHIEKLCQIH